MKSMFKVGYAVVALASLGLLSLAAPRDKDANDYTKSVSRPYDKGAFIGSSAYHGRC